MNKRALSGSACDNLIINFASANLLKLKLCHRNKRNALVDQLKCTQRLVILTFIRARRYDIDLIFADE